MLLGRSLSLFQMTTISVAVVVLIIVLWNMFAESWSCVDMKSVGSSCGGIDGFSYLTRGWACGSLDAHMK